MALLWTALCAEEERLRADDIPRAQLTAGKTGSAGGNEKVLTVNDLPPVEEPPRPEPLLPVPNFRPLLW
jgi:hypothetical protein